MKAIILARVSSEEQESNPAQIARLTEFAQSKGFDAPRICEIEESSSKADRKKFQEIVADIRTSEVKVALFVDTVDRLQRSFSESVVFDELRREDKIELFFYRENLHIHAGSNSADLIRWDMGVMFARSYVLQLSDNVKRRFEQKRKQGEWTAGPPFGYASVMLDERKRLRSDIVPHPVNAAYVKKMFELHASGDYSGRRIAEWLNTEGVRTNKGGKFHTASVHLILKNPFYRGEMRTRYGVYPHRYEPLVSKRLFLKVQRLLEARNRNPLKSIRKHEFALGGLIVCAHCGCAVTPELKKQRYVYYSCTNGKRICRRQYVNEAQLLEPIRVALRSISLTDDQIALILAHLKGHRDDEASRQRREDLERLRRQRDEIQEQQESLLDLAVRKQISEDMYRSKTCELGAVQETLEARLSARPMDDAQNRLAAQHVLSAAQRAEVIFDSGEPEHKRSLLECLIASPRLHDKELLFELQEPFSVIAEARRCLPAQLPTIDDPDFPLQNSNEFQNIAMLRGDHTSTHIPCFQGQSAFRTNFRTRKYGSAQRQNSSIQPSSFVLLRVLEAFRTIDWESIKKKFTEHGLFKK